MSLRTFVSVAVFSVLVSLPYSAAMAAQPIELSVDEYKQYQHYKRAIDDPRVQKLKPEARLAAIAKDAKLKPKDLEKAVAKGEAAGDLKTKCEQNIKELLDESDLKGRVPRIEVDTEDAHAVAYVQWLNEKPELLVVEASVAAAKAAAACPITSTITVWAQDKANPKARVFQALISTSAAAKINAERAKDFADTRYKRLFEKVKNVADGDDLSAESGTPAGAPAP